MLPVSKSAVNAPYDDPHMVVYSEINPKNLVPEEGNSSEKQGAHDYLVFIYSPAGNLHDFNLRLQYNIKSIHMYMYVTAIAV